MEKRLSLIRRIDNTGVPLLLARLFVGSIFAWLAYNKLLDPIEFLKQTREYHLVPEDPPIFLTLTAVVVPWLELLCAAALILGVYARGAAATLLAMLLFFAPLLLIRAWHLYQDPAGGFATFCAVEFDCGCGTGEVFICAKTLENTALMVGALLALLSRSKRFCLGALITRLRAEKTSSAAFERA
ncbi:MAG: DoxX family membrane protein [Phycisphaerae bacterium]|nr:DoxX family membrane protein [Phycisphaerae bacterium]